MVFGTLNKFGKALGFGTRFEDQCNTTRQNAKMNWRRLASIKGGDSVPDHDCCQCVLWQRPCDDVLLRVHNQTPQDPPFIPENTKANFPRVVTVPKQMTRSSSSTTRPRGTPSAPSARASGRLGCATPPQDPGVCQEQALRLVRPHL